ncbi:hypothetical protein [Spirosoma utsteinense]|uniref:Uncharacterized protein n=1 Tax=Spirosoma utsteinense TaxID=2585773 RepID=A0ABR6WCV4_9BACT|nr:hypothetical protein [Spirosoma utsteinense]MBC3788375.1 hypothetical protein [Spirosoma utsteinense]MBC3794361.1 hypothetical protein [Spirosoma utsteinense]
MNEQTNAPAQISEIDLDSPNQNNPADTDISEVTRRETLAGLQANDAEKMTPDDANELSEEESTD